ncbi:MAG: winged helix-turn-helix domain-containing protein [Paracoccaceae bacterium]
MADWYFSSDEGQLTRPERVVQLTPKAAAVLACLHRNRGEVVPIDVFLKDVWPNVHVAPDLIREYIHDLRDALNDDARHPRYIETVRGKGFRLIGDIDLAAVDEIADPTVSQRQASLPTLAVLKPHTPDDVGLDTIADEVVSEVINHLARFHYISVIASQRNFNSKEINDIRAFASDVNATYLLETNYVRSGGNVRVRAQLLDAINGRALWGERLDFDEDDPVSIVAEASDTIVLAMTGWHGELHRAEYKSVAHKQKGQLNAFDHFILGCDLEMTLDAEGLLISISHLDHSVRLDPTFARAWLVYALMLRWAYSVLPGRDRNYLHRSTKAFQTALKLAPTDPVNLALLSMNTARLGNLDGAKIMLSRAEATMRGDSDAMVCVATAKSVLTDEINEACTIFGSVMRRNRAIPSWMYIAEACIAFMAGDFARCIVSSRSGPTEISASAFCCLSLAMLGRENEAQKMRDELYVAFPKFDFERFAENFPIANSARRSRYDEAVMRLKQLAH